MLMMMQTTMCVDIFLKKFFSLHDASSSTNLADNSKCCQEFFCNIWDVSLTTNLYILMLVCDLHSGILI